MAIVPTLSGKTRPEAEDILRAARLELGEVQEGDPAPDPQKGKVTRQTPP